MDLILSWNVSVHLDNKWNISSQYTRDFSVLVLHVFHVNEHPNYTLELHNKSLPYFTLTFLNDNVKCNLYWHLWKRGQGDPEPTKDEGIGLGKGSHRRREDRESEERINTQE